MQLQFYCQVKVLIRALNITPTFLSFFMIICFNTKTQGTEYNLSRYTEAYNTKYLYCGDFSDNQKDTTIFLNFLLPTSFVLEIGALSDGERTAILYNDNKELLIANNNECLYVDGKKIGRKNCRYTKLSLYFVNGKLTVYQDDKKVKSWIFTIHPEQGIGLLFSRKRGYICHMFNCYEPIPFKVADYGAALEDGVVKNTGSVRVAQHSVDETYSLTFPTKTVKNSSRSIRFEYRFQDTKKEGISRMRRSRSEISGVFSSSPKNKWIIEYDFYVPQETQDDSSSIDIITQIHEGSATPTSPAFCLFMKGGYLCCTTKGDSNDLGEWVDKHKPKYSDSKKFAYIHKGRWYHIKIYLKEGWRPEDQPLARVWVDGNLLYETSTPNCYHYNVKPGSHYSYLKFGIYKGGWLNTSYVDDSLATRIYVFDNFVVKY